METRTLEIEGMSCGHCVARVERALKAVPGVDVKKVVVGRATIDVAEGRADDGAIRKAIDEAGYTVRESA